MRDVPQAAGMSMIKLGANAVPKSAEREIIRVFRSGQYSPGPNVRKFEESWAKAHESGHSVFVNSGTDALRVALLSLKEKYGWVETDQVAVTTLTFVATVNVILQANLRPYFYDAGNPWNLERRIETSETKLVAIMPVHLFGEPVDPYTYDLAAKYKLKVLEDSCETIGNKTKGDVSCHSTYMAHHVTTGVGGMASTNDGELNLLMRSYANHGRNVSYLPGYFTPKLGRNLLQSRFRFDRIGYSCRGTEFEAVLGLSQMRDLKKAVQKRRLVANMLWSALKPHWDKFDLKEPSQYPDHTFMMYPIVARENTKFDKYDFCLKLEEAGIETRDMMPITNQPCYRGIINENDYPVSKHINTNGFYIPCHPQMTKRDVDKIAQVFEDELQEL